MMRFISTFYALFALLACLLGSPAKARIDIKIGSLIAEKCQWAFSNYERFRPVTAQDIPSYFPEHTQSAFDKKQLVKAIEEGVDKSSLYGGFMNYGIWEFFNNSKPYLIKGIGTGSYALREIAKAEALHKQNLGPKVFYFRKNNYYYLISEKVPGINLVSYLLYRHIPIDASIATLSTTKGSKYLEEMKKAIGDTGALSPEQIEEEYLRRLRGYKTEIVEKLNSIKLKMEKENLRPGFDFQFMLDIDFTSGKIDIKVIDADGSVANRNLFNTKKKTDRYFNNAIKLINEL